MCILLRYDNNLYLKKKHYTKTIHSSSFSFFSSLNLIDFIKKQVQIILLFGKIYRIYRSKIILVIRVYT